MFSTPRKYCLLFWLLSRIYSLTISKHANLGKSSGNATTGNLANKDASGGGVSNPGAAPPTFSFSLQAAGSVGKANPPSASHATSFHTTSL
mmetsp:Transcript_17781/g.38475  ORF Transcript_17781/g.38475 Transcript_17781/m.38475 type:complete len:91 (+) Transcript_17781:58-330(+)